LRLIGIVNMLCPKCFQENDDNALFCKHCGSKLIKQENASDNTSSILLLVWAIVFIVAGSIQTLITLLVDDWYYGSWRTFYFLVCAIHNASNILPAIAIKNNTMKIIAIVLVAIPTLYYIYRNISAIFTEY